MSTAAQLSLRDIQQLLKHQPFTDEHSARAHICFKVSVTQKRSVRTECHIFVIAAHVRRCFRLKYETHLVSIIVSVFIQAKVASFTVSHKFIRLKHNVIVFI